MKRILTTFIATGLLSIQSAWAGQAPGAAADPDVAPARPFYLRAPDAKPAAIPPLAARAANP